MAIAAGAVAWPATAQDRRGGDTDVVERQAFEAALALAGESRAKLPISLTSVKPDSASAGVQGWTTVGPDGRGERVFIYSASPLFRCARASNENYQCLVKLASVIVHEAWHFRHDGGEAAAYSAQIGFLIAHHGALEQITDVRRSRNQAVAAERQAVEAARRLSGQDGAKH